MLLNILNYGALYDLDINNGYKLSILVKIKNSKLVIMTIHLGLCFPHDTVKITASKFHEIRGNNKDFKGVNEVRRKKEWYYEVNKEVVTNFSD